MVWARWGGWFLKEVVVRVIVCDPVYIFFERAVCRDVMLTSDLTIADVGFGQRPIVPMYRPYHIFTLSFDLISMTITLERRDLKHALGLS